jgi:hypothetical protein
MDFEIPALTATDWLCYLMKPVPDLDGILLDLLSETEDLLYDDKVSVDDLYRTVLDVVTLVGARPWWISLRLIGSVRASWDALGPRLMSKHDPNVLSLSAWLDAALVTILEAMEAKDTTMWKSKLEAPPPDIFGAVVEEPEMERDAFLSMMG